MNGLLSISASLSSLSTTNFVALKSKSVPYLSASVSLSSYPSQPPSTPEDPLMIILRQMIKKDLHGNFCHYDGCNSAFLIILFINIPTHLILLF